MEDFMIHLLLIAVLSLAGCYSSGNAGIKSEELVTQIKIGKSTKNDVTLLFGQPTAIPNRW